MPQERGKPAQTESKWDQQLLNESWLVFKAQGFVIANCFSKQ